jgi:hypothetical protein
MAAESTEMWSEYRSSYRDGKWTATRAWQVTGATNDTEARNASAIDGRPIAQVGNTHPENADMFCNGLDVESPSPHMRVVRAAYAVLTIPETNDNGSPLFKPAEIFVDWSETEEPFDIDADGVPILNAAAQKFDAYPTRPRSDMEITFIRNEPFYPLGKAIFFKDTTNSDTVVINPIGAFEPETLLCRPIRMAEPVTPYSRYVRVVYGFRHRPDGWRTRQMNVGYAGWYSDNGATKLGRFVDGLNNPVSEPVLLDGVGMPMDGSIKIDGQKTPVPAPRAVIPGFDYLERTDYAYFLKFKRVRSVAMAGIFS